MIIHHSWPLALDLWKKKQPATFTSIHVHIESLPMDQLTNGESEQQIRVAMVFQPSYDNGPV